MKRMQTSGIVLLLLTIAMALSGCGGGPMEWKGTLKGTYELKGYRDASSQPPLETGSGSARLYTGLVDHFRLGMDTPIPDCTFVVERSGAVDTTRRDYKGKDLGKAHTGEKYEGKGCVGRIDKDGPLVEIVIVFASVELSSSGEINIGMEYVPTPSDPIANAFNEYSRRRIFVMKGKRGWF